MSNLELLSAGFSAILGKDVVAQKNGGKYSIHHLVTQTYIMKPVETVEKAESGKGFDVFFKDLSGNTLVIQLTQEHTVEQVCAEIEMRCTEYRCIPGDELKLIYASKMLENHRTVKDYGIRGEETIHFLTHMCGGRPPLISEFNADDLHPLFDYDFSGVKDDGKRYMRGGFEYKRPYGWKRFAIKVVGRYENDAWLGPNGIRTGEAPGEWPVSYHGTNMRNAKLILKEGYKPEPKAKFGKGIYSSPSLEMVEKLYAQKFTHEGRTYKIVLQNRVNPDQESGHLQIIPASQTTVGADYWLSRGGGMTDVRPYGILIREVSSS